MTRVTVLIESVTETGASARGQASLSLRGFVSALRIARVIHGVAQQALESHRSAQRKQRFSPDVTPTMPVSRDHDDRWRNGIRWSKHRGR